MATGSGKTLIMAASILYLYEQGYNKFVFFVDKKNTIDKTRENFLNKAATKYLFSEDISIEGKSINIEEVDNFEGVSEENINIVFNTIQKLHDRLNNPRENSITYKDFEDEKIVLISDEAHHLNALTKGGGTKSDERNIRTWERTIDKIHQKNSENILLEYTATVPNDPAVMDKYNDKIIYQYPLEKFRIDKYSKEVEVLEGDLDPLDRALQAAVVSQYRRKVAEKHKIDLKPVIMMKSDRVTEPDNYNFENSDKVVSKVFREKFHNMIKKLDVDDLEKVRSRTSGGIIDEAFNFFEDNNISLENLVEEFKISFGEERCISVDTKEESEEKQVLVNTLEDGDNPIRVVFACDKLNEGWDVLNLFDIVRTYETRSGRRGQPGKTTIKEAQLIGRGARYCPFKLEEDQDKYKRKYDDKVDSELRVLEELYYHCYHEPRYISELKKALKEEGIYPADKKERELKVKGDFKETSFWENGLIFKNDREETDRSGVTNLSDFDVSEIHRHRLRTGYSSDVRIFEEEAPEVQERDTESYSLSEFRVNVLRKALSKLKFYKFQNLKNFFPNLSSIREFISSEDYLGKIDVEVTGTPEQIQDLGSAEKLEISVGVCKKISQEIKSNSKKYSGTKVFIGKPVRKVVENKTRMFDIKNRDSGEGIPMKKTGNEELRMDLSEEDWYVYNENYGTDQEKYFVRFLKNMIDRLLEEYDDVYLVRNEKLFQLYDFEEGRPFEPDFVLFLKEGSENPIHYQLFVESKGEQFQDANGGFKDSKEGWKEVFLERIKEEHEVQILAENEEYRIIGLPFYNEDVSKEDFKKEFKKELKLRT